MVYVQICSGCNFNIEGNDTNQVGDFIPFTHTLIDTRAGCHVLPVNSHLSLFLLQLLLELNLSTWRVASSWMQKISKLQFWVRLLPVSSLTASLH